MYKFTVNLSVAGLPCENCPVHTERQAACCFLAQGGWHGSAFPANGALSVWAWSSFIGTGTAWLVWLDHSRMLINPPVHWNWCLCTVHSLRHAHRAGYCCFCETLHGALGDSLESLQTLTPTETCQRCHASGKGSLLVVQGPPGSDAQPCCQLSSGQSPSVCQN